MVGGLQAPDRVILEEMMTRWRPLDAEWQEAYATIMALDAQLAALKEANAALRDRMDEDQEVAGQLKDMQLRKLQVLPNPDPTAASRCRPSGGIASFRGGEGRECR